HAPKGARGDWLPRSEWVMSSWAPFDEARLYSVLGTDRAEVAAWLNDHRTLGRFAAEHGHRDQAALADTLVAPRLRTASPAMRRALRRRSRDMLSQAHLARHVLFHIYHTPAIPRHAQEIFGMATQPYRRLRDSGWSPQRIAAAGHVPLGASRATLRSILVRRGDQAVRIGAMSRRQADALLAHQDAGLSAYMTRRYRTPAQQVAFVCRPR
ncbi:MAG: hypothetical protein QOE11_3624, partial [Solirubrobacteraceae bacterium]|nr:hypothetical protein [Solirubrobacteraceae bacterium]